MDSSQTVRPYFVPEGIDFDSLPSKLQAAITAIVASEAINSDAAQLGQLKIAVLGELDVPEIPGLCGLDERAIKAWESLFFDVRGARGEVGRASLAWAAPTKPEALEQPVVVPRVPFHHDHEAVRPAESTAVVMAIAGPG